MEERRIQWLSQVRFRDVRGRDLEKLPVDGPANQATDSYAYGTFQKNLGKLIYLSQFRRQGGKTQVYSMPKDNVRNRLTHSIEVSHVAEQLLGIFIKMLEKGLEEAIKNELYLQLLTVLRASCLVHDIGHPPFAHSGERILAELRQTFSGRFDSNLQNLRILTGLSPVGREYELNLSCSVIDSTLKEKAVGFFQARESRFWLPEETSIMENICRQTGTLVDIGDFPHNVPEQDIRAFNNADRRKQDPIPTHGKPIFLRHPITYFMTCADDICYLSSDVEDAINRKGLDLEFVLSTLDSCGIEYRDPQYEKTNKEWVKGFQVKPEENNPRRLRTAILKSLIGRTINILQRIVTESAEIYKTYQNERMTSYLADLHIILARHSVSHWTPGTEFGNFLYMRLNENDDYGSKVNLYKKQLFRERLFMTREVLEENAKAKNIVESICAFLLDGMKDADDPAYFIKSRSAFIGGEFERLIAEILGENRTLPDRVSSCEAVFFDFIAGMTDQYAEQFLELLRSSEFMKREKNNLASDRKKAIID